MAKKQKAFRPYHPAKYTKRMAIAIQAVAAGIANEGQQRMAMNWIIEECSRYQDLNYFPDSERDSSFSSGRGFVGKQLVKIIKIKVGSLPDDPKES